jgi:hypothetical protein
MEVLLIACMLAYAAGSQNEQSKLGLSPAQRAIIREQVRHEKAVRKIAEKHGTAPPASPRPGSAPGTELAAVPEPVTVPEAFTAAYRSHTPVARVATPAGRRVGDWTARGVHWAKDTGRSAVREYRKRRQAAGEPDPAPVLVPLPPDRPPAVPPMPDHPPTVGTDDDGGGRTGVSLAKPDGAETAPERPAEPPAGDESPRGAPESSTGPENAADGPAMVPSPRGPEELVGRDDGPEEALENGPTGAPVPAEPVTEPVAGVTAPETPVTEPVTADKAPVTDSVTADKAPVTDSGAGLTPLNEEGGVGRMAAEVSYDSVMDESDELSLMCDDDVTVYGRIRQRCEREIGRADELVAQLESVGAGSGVIAWVARCKEQYQMVHAQLDELERNTISQGEAVARAKALLEAGQGLYVGIAADMESVAERDFYISDAVDGEDTSAQTETYETQGA